MSILDSILQNPSVVSKLSSFGVDPATATKLIEELAPSLAGGLHTQLTSQGASADAVKAAVQDGSHQETLDNPNAVVASDDTSANALVGHLLGGSEATSALTDKVSNSTGVSKETLEQMLPTLASLVMGSASKQAAASGGISGLLSSLSQNPQTASLVSGVMGMFGKKSDAA
jgi:hypothetical protein